MLQMKSEFKLWAITIAKAVSLCKAFLFHCFLFYFVEMFFPPVLEANEMLRKTPDESVTNKKSYSVYISFTHLLVLFLSFFLFFFFFFVIAAFGILILLLSLRSTYVFQKMSKIVISFFGASPLSTCLVS